VIWANIKTKKVKPLANYAAQALILSLENLNVIPAQQVTFVQIPHLLQSSVKLEHIQQQDQLHALLVMMVISVNLKSKLQILNTNFAQQVSFVSTMTQMILILSKFLVPLVSISH
jgi:hypothetical protein